MPFNLAITILLSTLWIHGQTLESHVKNPIEGIQYVEYSVLNPATESMTF